MAVSWTKRQPALAPQFPFRAIPRQRQHRSSRSAAQIQFDFLAFRILGI